MEEFLAFVTIDVWTLIFTWGNLIILFLVMKKFLFKPVKGIIDARDEEIKSKLDDADESVKKANELKEEYELLLASAKDEADEIVKNATKKAMLREEEILSDAQTKARGIMERAEAKIELDKKKMENDVKNDVASMAVLVASKIIEKDLSEKDNEEIIEKFINEIGDDK
jgi:F-type H+-transporting ATPase subunit b